MKTLKKVLNEYNFQFIFNYHNFNLIINNYCLFHFKLFYNCYNVKLFLVNYIIMYNMYLMNNHYNPLVSFHLSWQKHIEYFLSIVLLLMNYTKGLGLKYNHIDIFNIMIYNHSYSILINLIYIFNLFFNLKLINQWKILSNKIHIIRIHELKNNKISK